MHEDRPREVAEDHLSDLIEKPVSRRDFLKMAGVAGAAVGLGAGLGGVVAACGGAEETTTTAAPTATTASTAGHGHHGLPVALPRLSPWKPKLGGRSRSVL